MFSLLRSQPNLEGCYATSRQLAHNEAAMARVYPLFGKICSWRARRRKLEMVFDSTVCKWGIEPGFAGLVPTGLSTLMHPSCSYMLLLQLLPIIWNSGHHTARFTQTCSWKSPSLTLQAESIAYPSHYTFIILEKVRVIVFGATNHVLQPLPHILLDPSPHSPIAMVISFDIL